MKRARFCLLSGALFAGAVLGGRANADLLGYEGFDYAEGTDLSGQTGGTGWLGGWSATVGDTAAAGSLGYTDSLGNQLLTSGNHAFYTGSGGTVSTNRDLPAIRGAEGGGDGTTTWISFVGQRLGEKSGDPLSYQRAANVATFNSVAGGEQLAVGEATGRAEDTWSMIFNGTATTTQASAVPFDQLSLIVLRIDHLAGNDNAYLFVNPILGVEPDIGLANATMLAASDFSFDRLRPFAGNTTAAGVFADFQLDEIRVGETYGDVTPLVPEPTALAFLGLGLMALHRRRRA